MTPLSALAVCASMMLSAQLTFQLDLKDSTRIGNSYTPNVAPGLGDDYNFSEILTPGAQFTGDFANEQALMLRYAPNFLYIKQFASPTDPNNVLPLSILHRIQANYSVGAPRDLKFTVGGNLAFGTMDLSTFSEVGGATEGVTGTFAQSPTNQLTDYFGLSGFVGFEKQWGNKLRFLNQEVGGVISSSNPNQAAATTVNQANSLTQLQDERSFFSRNEMQVRIDAKNQFLADVQLSGVLFPGITDIYGVMPQVGWDYAPSTTTNLRAAVGAMVFLQTDQNPNVLKRTPNYVSDILAVNVNWNTGFIKAPKLHLNLAFSILPFYDLNFGNLEPRTMLTVNFMYDFTTKVHGMFGLRGITGEYLTFSGWAPVLNGRTKYMGLANVQFSFQVAKWLLLNVGAYGDIRAYQPFAGEPPQLREYYGMIGFTGTWHTGGTQKAKAPTGTASGGISGTGGFQPMK